MAPTAALYRQWARFQVIALSRVPDGTGVELLVVAVLVVAAIVAYVAQGVTINVGP